LLLAHCLAARAADGLPAHLSAVRRTVGERHEKNRGRIASQRRRGGKLKKFEVGDCVLLLPQKFGRIGTTIDPKRIVCRVVGIQSGFGMRKYQLRCNVGLLEGTYFDKQLEPAPPASEQQLTFTGVETKGVPCTTLKNAVASQRIAGAPNPCGCRGKCGSNCRCKKHGSVCSRECGCKALRCGNHA
jgi:hypothetical protein